MNNHNWRSTRGSTHIHTHSHTHTYGRMAIFARTYCIPSPFRVIHYNQMPNPNPLHPKTKSEPSKNLLKPVWDSDKQPKMSSLCWFTTPTGPHIDSKHRYTHSCCICGAESCTAWGLSVQHTSVCMRTRPAISSSTQTQHINTHKACFRGKWASFSLHCAVSVWSPAGSWAFLYESWWTESEKQKENNNLLSSRSARKKVQLVREKKNCICLWGNLFMQASVKQFMTQMRFSLMGKKS